LGPLSGTTYRVYKYMFSVGRPVGVHDIQRALKLSSPSVAEYHVQKLLRFNLIREEREGYVVDTVVFENIIRIRRRAVPVQIAYVGFFAVLLASLLTIFRPQTITSTYFVSIVGIIVAMAIFIREAVMTLRRIA
jgi:predicted DNA-binding transcriptional regulator